MTRKHRFDLQAGSKSPAQLARSRHDAMKAAKAFGRLRLDGEASTVVGYGVVVSVHRVNGGYLIVELDSVDEAMAFVAEANGETDADVVATARRYAEYLHNVRTRKRAPAKGTGKKESNERRRDVDGAASGRQPPADFTSLRFDNDPNYCTLSTYA